MEIDKCIGGCFYEKYWVNSYGFSIQDRENQRYELHNIKGRSLIDILYSYMQRYVRTYSTDNFAETVFTFDEVNVECIMNEQNQEKYTILYGRVKTGEYGIESNWLIIKQGMYNTY